jgi:hypothetical protein
MNAAMKNSKIPISMKRMNTFAYTGEEIHDSGKMLDAFSKVPNVLDSADTAFILVGDSSAAGLGYYDTDDWPFALATHASARDGIHQYFYNFSIFFSIFFLNCF